MHASRHGQIDLPSLEACDPLVQRDKRRRARDTHGHCRPSETECERDSLDRHASNGADVAFVTSARHNQVPVFAAANSDINAGPASRQTPRNDSCVLECLPAYFQQQPLPGIRHPCLDRRNSEEL